LYELLDDVDDNYLIDYAWDFAFLFQSAESGRFCLRNNSECLCFLLFL